LYTWQVLFQQISHVTKTLNEELACSRHREQSGQNMEGPGYHQRNQSDVVPYLSPGHCIVQRIDMDLEGRTQTEAKSLRNVCSEKNMWHNEA